MTNRFGLAIDSKNFIIDIKYFEQEDFNPKYFEISEAQFYYFNSIRKPFSKFIGGELINDPEDEKAYLLQKNIDDLRFQLTELHIKIGLAERMQEDTKDLLAEFERVKVLYNNLNNI